jgi:hypothetical protein
MNGDCKVDILDIMYVAGRWNTQLGDPDYDPKADLDGDGDIDVLDIMKVAGQWMQTCDDSAMTLFRGYRSSPSAPPLPASQSSFPPLPLAVTRASQNGLSFYLPLSFHQVPSLPQLYPLELTTVKDMANGDFTLEIALQNIEDLGGIEFTLLYDSSLLQALEAETGDFLADTGRSVFALGPIIDNETGMIRFGAFSFGDQPGASGSGVVAHIVFRPLTAGQSDILWQNVLVSDTKANTITVLPVAGYIQIISTLPTFTPTPRPTPISSRARAL